MKLKNSPDRYGAGMMFLHWSTALLVGLAWALGLSGDELPRGAARDAVRFIHISAGLLVFAFLWVRTAWRIADPAPPREAAPPLIEWATKLTHLALYALLLAVPIAGVVAQFADGKPLPVFGLLQFASPWPKDHAFAESWEEIHEVLAHALVFIAMVHAGAAIVHHRVLKDRTLVRMLPHAGGR